MTVPGVSIPGFRGKAGHANSWKARNPEQKSRLSWKAGNFALTITVQVSQV